MELMYGADVAKEVLLVWCLASISALIMSAVRGKGGAATCV